MHHGREPGDPLVLGAPWDAASARAFADAGFPALATSSAATAAALGYEDGEHTPPAEMFAAVARIVRAVDVPVSADVENGYGLPPRELAERLLEAGAAGCNLEDSAPGGRLLEPERHADRLAALSEAAGGQLFLNARVDTFLFGDGSVSDALSRGRRYLRAGAECVFPILAPPEHLPELAAGLDAPLNALAGPDSGPRPRELGELGATRVTFGGGVQQAVTGLLRDLIRGLRGPGRP
ncbi:isocitrate lyase/phosphoenolpyruvate mutase family protein [Streptomyces sodiiphilus]|uniref:Isocitrate lyase/phosphoenolpyruvate mutase family protein n=1 Tax=Streptomyces sodiiphilus TaxID=226217 RepID=A0ABP5A552_9ACTN